MLKICKECGIEFDSGHGNRLYCTSKCRRKKNRATFQTELRIDRRRRLIELHGGECKYCGYDKNYAALHFHHTKDKSFSINARTTSAYSFDTLAAEARKCVILCGNCHAEHHHPHMDKSNLSSKSERQGA